MGKATKEERAWQVQEMMRSWGGLRITRKQMLGDKVREDHWNQIMNSL